LVVTFDSNLIKKKKKKILSSFLSNYFLEINFHLPHFGEDGRIFGKGVKCLLLFGYELT
jgi:hypothetical protein